MVLQHHCLLLLYLLTVLEHSGQHLVDTLPEVDLIGLVGEQLPRYTLHADAVTDFTGYSNADWTVQTPCLKLPNDFSFSAEFIEETLKYFGKDGKMDMCVLHVCAFILNIYFKNDDNSHTVCANVDVLTCVKCMFSYVM